jgi:hypothetical protein
MAHLFIGTARSELHTSVTSDCSARQEMGQNWELKCREIQLRISIAVDKFSFAIWSCILLIKKEIIVRRNSDSNIARITWNYECSTTSVVLMVFFSQLTGSTNQFQKGAYSEELGDLHSCSTVPSSCLWLGEETGWSLGRTQVAGTREGCRQEIGRAALQQHHDVTLHHCRRADPASSRVTASVWEATNRDTTPPKAEVMASSRSLHQSAKLLHIHACMTSWKRTENKDAAAILLGDLVGGFNLWQNCEWNPRREEKPRRPRIPWRMTLPGSSLDSPAAYGDGRPWPRPAPRRASPRPSQLRLREMRHPRLHLHQEGAGPMSEI